jgi:hypothetical protein
MFLSFVIAVTANASTDRSSELDDEYLYVVRDSDYDVPTTENPESTYLGGTETTTSVHEETERESGDPITFPATEFMVEDMDIKELAEVYRDIKYKSPVELFLENQGIVLLVASVVLAVIQQLMKSD